MQQIDVDLGKSSSYTVCIGSGILSKSFHPPYPSVALITESELTHASWWSDLEKTLRESESCKRLEILTIPSGEKSKSLKIASALYTALAQKRFGRETTIVAVGGGVVGDLAGFVAATYVRGVPWIVIPTTLLASVDSSVGGKVGVNLAEGKNLVGAFHQPASVLIDTSFLGTLPERQIQSAMAEVMKYGLIADVALFHELERDEPLNATRDRERLQSIIARSVQIKASVVGQDEKETSGVRAILNFGHTLGHALEQLGEYTRWLHGEAVAIGMVMAAELSTELTGLPSSVPQRIRALLTKYGLPISIPKELEPEALYNVILRDKKATDQGISWVLLRQIGEPVLSRKVDFTIFKKIFDRCTE